MITTTHYRLKSSKPGQLLIELLIALALLGIFTPALVGAIIVARSGSTTAHIRQQATLKLTETAEALRSIREQGWSNIATPGNYHPILTNGVWSLQPNSITEDDLTTNLAIAYVQRDASGDVVTSGGHPDPSTMAVTITVSWTEPQPGEVTSSLYLTRYLDNLALTDTTEADFTGGELQGTAIINTTGGEIILGSGGRGNWCLPANYIRTTYNMPQDGKANVVRALEGKIFSGTDYGNQGKFVHLGVDQQDPPQITQFGQINGYDTNDIFIESNYAYIATDDASRDIVIIDLSTNQEVGYYNDTFWWGTAQGIYVKGNVGYAVIGPKLHAFDLSSKTGQRPELGSVNLQTWGLATGYRVIVKGNYAYVALDWGSAEMQIVNVTNPRSMSRAGYANVNSERGKDVFVNQNGTRVYLATAVSGSKNELFIIDTTSKSGSRTIISSYDSQGMDPKGLSLVTENKLILVGVGGEEYQVIDLTNETAPTRCGGLNLDTGVYGVAGVLESDGEAYSYIITKEPSSELKVIEGGAGETYSTAGTYKSNIIDAGYATAYNYISIQKATPIDTTARFQVAGADPISGSCELAVYAYVGPDGTNQTYFDDAGSIPFNDDGQGYENPARCFRYQLFLETAEQTATPVVESATINYSP